MIGSTEHDQAVTQVLTYLRRCGLLLSDVAGEDRASAPSQEKLRRITQAWQLMAKLGIIFADLEAAAPVPAKSSRGRRGEGVSSQATENTREPPKHPLIEIIEEFAVSAVCDPGSETDRDAAAAAIDPNP